MREINQPGAADSNAFSDPVTLERLQITPEAMFSN